MFQRFILWIQPEIFSGERLIFTCCLFFIFLCFDSHAAETKISDADATNIVLRNIRKLESGGYPRFAPDGKQILFTKTKKGKYSLEIGTSAIWVMDRDGKNKKVLLEDSYNGAWSPDGAKIAYCSSQGALSIYDIKARKKFELIERFGKCQSRDVRWAKDEKRLFFDGVMKKHSTASLFGGNVKWFMNGGVIGVFESGIIVGLDTLQQEEIKDSGDYKDEWNWVTPPKNVEIFDVAPGGPEGELKLDNIASGWRELWIGNRDKSFGRPLLSAKKIAVVKDSTNISPDLSKILFEREAGTGRSFFNGLSEDVEIYIADIVVAKDKDLPARTFRVPIGLKTLIEEATRKNPRLDSFKFTEVINRVMEEGVIYANVSDPKVNPLTKKTIDHGDKDKALVKLIKVFDDYSIVRVVEEREPVAIGDVIWELEASINIEKGKKIERSGYNWDIWGVIEAKAERMERGNSKE